MINGIVFGILFLVFLQFSSGNAEERKLTLVMADGKFVENNVAAIRVLQEAYHRIGYDLRVQRVPGRRALVMSNAGLFDGEVHRVGGIGKIYENLIQISTPVVTVPHHVFAMQDMRIDGWKSLKAYKIAVVIGHVLVEQNTRNMEQFFVPTWDSSFQLVYTGRADVTIVNKYRGMEAIRRLGLRGIRLISPAISLTPLYHYLHKKNASLVKPITEILKEMKASGRILKILREVEAEWKDKDRLPPERARELKRFSVE